MSWEGSAGDRASLTYEDQVIGSARSPPSRPLQAYGCCVVVTSGSGQADTSELSFCFLPFFNGDNPPLVEIGYRRTVGSHFEADNIRVLFSLILSWRRHVAMMMSAKKTHGRMSILRFQEVLRWQKQELAH